MKNNKIIIIDNKIYLLVGSILKNYFSFPPELTQERRSVREAKLGTYEGVIEQILFDVLHSGYGRNIDDSTWDSVISVICCLSNTQLHQIAKDEPALCVALNEIENLNQDLIDIVRDNLKFLLYNKFKQDATRHQEEQSCFATKLGPIMASKAYKCAMWVASNRQQN